MKRRLFLGLLVGLVVLIAGGCHQTADVSLEEQIEKEQGLPAGSVTLVLEGALEGEGEQVFGFFDGEGNPGLAVVSGGETPRLLSVEPAGSFFSRAPDTWTVPISFGEETCYVFLSNNPAFACLKVQRAEGQWEEIPVPAPPSMVSFSLPEGEAVEYLLCDSAGNEL